MPLQHSKSLCGDGGGQWTVLQSTSRATTSRGMFGGRQFSGSRTFGEDSGFLGGGGTDDPMEKEILWLHDLTNRIEPEIAEALVLHRGFHSTSDDMKVQEYCLYIDNTF